MIARKLLLSAFALLTLVFVGCKDDEPKFVALNVETKDIVEGQEYQFYVESYQGTITWSIDSEKVATIDQTGRVKGLKVGVTNVRAHLSNGKSLMAVLTVNARTLDTDSISVSIETLKLAPNSTFEIDVDIVKKEYLDSKLYPLHVTLDKVVATEAKEVIPNPATVESVFRADSTGYDISLFAGSEKTDYICKISIGDFEQEIPVTVDYGVYLSHKLLEPNKLNDAELLTYKTHKYGLEGKDIEYSFFCYLDGASDVQRQIVEENILNKENYIHEGLSLEIGDITIDKSSDVWVVNVPLVSKAKTYENGIVALTIEDKTLELNLTLDDGKSYNELYISFESIYTYSEETKTGSRKLDASYMKYVDKEQLGDTDEKEQFDVIVYYTMSPDDRGDFINWNLTLPQGPTAPVKFIGMKNMGDKTRFAFTFEVQAAGEANIGISIENPKADDPMLSDSEKEFYEKYRTQTLTAMVNVINRQAVDVESIVFVDSEDPLTAEVIKKMDVSSKSTPLYSYILPEESAGAWPAVYSVECTNGAEATVKQASVDEKTGTETPATLEVTHAGTIVVTATSKDKTSQLLVDAKLKINQLAEGKKLTLTSKKESYTIGETEKLSVKLLSDFKVYDYEYTWTSSDPKVISVDEFGNITAIAEGTATITASKSDAYEYTAEDSKELSVRAVNASVNFDAPEYAEHLVIKDLNEDAIGKYYVDTEETSTVYTLYMDKDITENGVYTVGTDITGTIEFPSGDRFNLVEGTITISDEGWTFDLKVSNVSASGTVTGTKPYVEF